MLWFVLAGIISVALIAWLKRTQRDLDADIQARRERQKAQRLGKWGAD